MPRPDDPSNPSANGVYRLAAWTAFAVMRAQRWRIDVQGGEHVPTTGGAVVTANHTSFWDFFTIGRAPYLERGRPVRILAKASLFRTPVFGTVLDRAGHIPVHRGAGASALRDAVAALRAGELVLVLPEQTVSPSLELLPFKHGAVRMAQAAGVPLVPSVSWGTHRFHTVGRRPSWQWRLPVLVRYGQPLEVEPGDDIALATAELRRRTTLLLDAAQRDYPDGAPPGAWWVPARLGGAAPTPEETQAHLDRMRERWRDERGQRRSAPPRRRGAR